MTEAILSCVHANLAALEAVLADISRQGIARLVSLGDIVGYGLHPRECLRLLRHVEVSIMGNHEEAVLFYGTHFHPQARPSPEETKAALDSPNFPTEENLDLWDFLGCMQEVVEVSDVMYCHGSPRVPTREYVVPSDVSNTEKMDGIFDLIKRLCFVGHSHISHAYRGDGWHASPEEIGGVLDLREHAGHKFLINVGSVGQPRDGRPGASYVTFDGNVVRFHRVLDGCAAPVPA